jgi:gliding motility-associated-like protein
MFSAFSDTVSTLFLNLVNQGNGSALLSWNDIHDSASSALPYRIFRKVAGGAFVLIDSSLSNSFVDTVSVCSLAVSYFVTLADSAGCHHRSNIRSSVFEDKISPLGVVIDSVSVNAAGHPVVGWLSSPSPDVNRFVVLRNGQAVDTVAASPFTDLAVNGGLLSYCYSIVPMDSCGNAGDSSAVHCSIRLSALVDKCNRVVRLSWNDNQDSTGQGFEVWATFNGGGAGLLASLSQGISSFVHSQVVPGGIYCYFIRKKLSGGRTTSSNRLCVKADFSPAKGFAYLRVATVANSGDVLLRVFSDTAVPLRYFTVLRKSGSHAFDSIAAVTWAPSVSNFVFDDMTAETGKRSYSYRVVAVDSCFNRDTSNIARTVFLNCVELNVYSNRLTWNDYGDWAAGTDHYLIHRFVEGNEVMPPLFVPFSGTGDNSFFDDVSMFGDKASLFCYVIEAVEGQGNSVTGSADTSFSNVGCLLRKPLIVVPNAFTPEGNNPVFKPVIPFLNGGSYSMVIFNRYGQKVFESADVNHGWDGRFKGEIVPQGVYAYVIRVVDRNGNEFEKYGEVVVVR